MYHFIVGQFETLTNNVTDALTSLHCSSGWMGIGVLVDRYLFSLLLSRFLNDQLQYPVV